MPVARYQGTPEAHSSYNNKARKASNLPGGRGYSPILLYSRDITVWNTLAREEGKISENNP